MNTPAKILIVLAVAAAVVAAVALKKNKTPTTSDVNGLAITTARLPRLIDIGADKCIPCIMMAPILAELRSEYAGRMNVGFIDVLKNPGAGKPYGVEMIPTQIFYDAEGRELFRHVGFIGKEDILNKWKELGVDLSGKPSAGIVRETPVVADTTARDAKPMASTTKGLTPNAPAQQVIAYYFHGTVRCETCLEIEKQARTVIERQFKTELDAKRLRFMPVNYEQPENLHFLTDYKLPCPSLVLVRQTGGKGEKWKLLGEIWQMVHDPVKLSSYVETEVKEFLSDPE